MNTETLVERLHWDKDAPVCQMWEKQNSMTRKGVDITIAQGIEIEKKLRHKCQKIAACSEYLTMGHTIAVLLVAVVTLIFFPGLIKAGLIMLATIVVAPISLLVTTKISLETRKAMHTELMLHQSRTHRFCYYMIALSETLYMDEKHLFVFPSAYLSVIADTCLKGLAGIIIYYESLGDAVSKEQAKEQFKKAHKLFVLGGLIPDKPYDKYFQEQPEVIRVSGILMIT